MRQKLLVSMALVSLFTLPAVADPPREGMVVGIRGKILEIQPPYLRAHVRLVYDGKTRIVEESRVAVAQLTPGTRVLCFGGGNTKSGVTVHWILAGILDGFVSGKQVGLHTEYGGTWFAGTLEKLKPFTVRDDAGTEIVATVKARGARLVRNGNPSDIMMGRKIDFSFDNANGGVYHATQIGLNQSVGKTGIIFATVQKYNENRLTVLPRFADKSIDVTLVRGARIQRQVTLDPDSIRVGQTITAWGTSASPGQFRDLTAYALMPGHSVCPFAGADSSTGERTVSGTVASMDPLIIRTKSETKLPLYITGQTPYMRVVDASTAALHPGARVMLLLDHEMQSKYVLIDASPILAFGL